jgi:hypothetical protein
METDIHMLKKCVNISLLDSVIKVFLVCFDAADLLLNWFIHSPTTCPDRDQAVYFLRIISALLVHPV